VPSFQLYANAQLAAWSGAVGWSSDSVVATLHGPSYLPNLTTDAHVSDLSGELSTGAGYTQGGLALPGRSASYLAAGSWPDVWAPLTSYVVGQVVRPALTPGLLFRCWQAGASGASAPSWPSVLGQSVTDGGAAWLALSAGAVALTASPLQWQSFTASFRYVVISDRTSGSASAQPLIALGDMGQSVTGAGGNLSVTYDAGSGSGIVIPLWSP
jgi:hypothetical protein